MVRFRSVLKLEALDAREVPSAATPLHGGHRDPLPAVAPRHYALAGHGGGSYATDEVWTDAGPQYHLSGSAQVADLGRVTIAGSVGGVGFVQRGHAHGSLTLSGAKGSVTLEL